MEAPGAPVGVKAEMGLDLRHQRQRPPSA
jgi:hypothetical protein